MYFSQRVVSISFIFSTLFLNSCGSSNYEPLSDFTPSSNNSVEAHFSRPFEENHPNSWPFDHDLPLNVFNDTKRSSVGNPDVLNWRGEIVKVWWGDGHWHNGYDFPMKEGTPLFALADGVVTFAGSEEPFECGNRMVAAIIVAVRYTFGSERFESRYVHVSELNVKVGDVVKRGQVIALSGNTGCSSAPHLHMSIRRERDDGKWVFVDPFGWEGNSSDPWELDADGAKSSWLWKKGEAPQGDYSY